MVRSATVIVTQVNLRLLNCLLARLLFRLFYLFVCSSVVVFLFSLSGIVLFVCLFGCLVVCLVACFFLHRLYNMFFVSLTILLLLPRYGYASC